MVAFEIVVVVVCVVSAVIATVAFIGARRLYDQIGRTGTFSLSPESDVDDGARRLVREEVRETLNAISALREARGADPVHGDQVHGDQVHGDHEDEHAQGQLQLPPEPEHAERRPSARGA